MMRIALGASLVVAAASMGCDDGSKKNQQATDAKAKAEQSEADAKAQSAAVAERKAKREAEFKAAQESEQKVASELERLCVAPDKLPKKVPTCEDVATAQDAFVRKVSSPEEVSAWEGGGKEDATAMTIVQCTQADSSQVAVCQKNALDGAGPELKDHVDKILQTCIDKYGKAGGGGAAVAVPKKRPG